MSMSGFNDFLKELTDREVELERVKIRLADQSWAIFFTASEPVPAERFDQCGRQLTEQVPGLQRVEFFVRPADQEYCLAMILENCWEEIQQMFGERYAGLLNGAFPLAEGGRLTVVFEQKADWEKALENDLCGLIEQWIYQRFYMRFVVCARHRETATAAPEAQHFIKHQPLQNNVVTAETPVRKPGYKGGNGNGREAKDLSKMVPVPIGELQEGLRFCIEGEIIDTEVREIKGNRKLVTYSVTDYSDTIAVKRIDDEQLPKGTWVKVFGGVRYDNFDREVILYGDAIEKVEGRIRMDNADEKRVELHLHTNMSTLDGLTDIGEVIKTAARMGHECLAITDHGNVQAFPEAFSKGKEHGVRILYGLEGYLVDEARQSRSYHIILLATNRQGLINLYKLISLSYLNNFYRTPRILRSELIAYREGLLLGTACERGELMRALLEGESEAEIHRIVDFYDYLEIQPLGNNAFLVRDGSLGSIEDLMEINRKIVALGREKGKPVVGTGDVHFLEPAHEVYRRILQAGKGFEDAESQAPLYYRTTEEMLQEFEYLGPETAYEVVVANPKAVAARCEELRPVPKGHFFPKLEGAAEKLTSLTWERARQVYGDPTPEIVTKRLERELYSITHHGFSELYLVAYELVKKSNSDGYVVGSRGSVGSSLAAHMLGITEVNPLVPHYRCTCGYNEFVEDSSQACGPDMPAKNCPTCGSGMIQDGFDIPFETFLGFEGDKDPDIDLNFSGDYQSRAHQFVEEYYGKENVFRAGTIATVAEKTAFGYVKKYEEAAGARYRRAEIDRLVKGITGIKRTTGQHPGGVMIVPPDIDVHEFTPLQRPAEDAKSEITTTHFDYHALSGVLVKLDVLGHDDPTMIKALEDATGIPANTVPLNDPATLALFSGVESLGVSPEQIRSVVGTYGVPEFGTRFVRQMLEATKPKRFSELVRISGLSHGTDVWTNNAADLIRNQVATLNEVIATRDDIMTYLIYQGLEKKLSFDIMERVRKGKKLTPEQESQMREQGITEWYINSCNRIQYMFPKAHAVAYVTMGFRIAYFKVHYPLAFYSGYFSIRAGDFDQAMVAGYDEIVRRLQEIEDMGHQAPPKEKNLIPVLELGMEMVSRGFKFYPVDLEQSEADRFRILEDGLLLPFSALQGVGDSAAKNIVAAREEKAFLSVDDLQRRGKVNKAVIEMLRNAGCLGELPESAQLSLFG
ncbi:MAG: PolC-type DNA polymerase III [Solirubrobacterales bacterium]